jgi:ParB-like chromosome segregation protein Spo0J
MSDLFSNTPNYIKDLANQLADLISKLDLNERVESLNDVRELLHKTSPFSSEPVDYVRWVKSDEVHANDYNPNSVAPPEMKLLEHSILNDGYTQPIVTWPNNGFEVVDGFHRNRVGKESSDVGKRIHGYLPLVVLDDSRHDKNDRMAATIRHNRARGKHKVESMSEIIVELKRRRWNNDKIAKELGMESDEVLRLTQISGIAEMFKDSEFSKAWEASLPSEEDYIDG